MLFIIYMRLSLEYLSIFYHSTFYTQLYVKQKANQNEIVFAPVLYLDNYKKGTKGIKLKMHHSL